MTTLEALERKLERKEGRARHVALLLSLFGDMRLYEYTGKVIDHGAGAATGPNPPTCACGHPVRFQFEIRRKDGAGQPAYLGSHCIEYVGVLAPELGAALSKAVDDLEAKVKEAEARARRAAAEGEATAALERYKAAWEVVDTFVQRERALGRWLPKPIWMAMVARNRTVLPPWAVPQYQHPGHIKRWANRQMELLFAALDECGFYSLKEKAQVAANAATAQQKGGEQ